MITYRRPQPLFFLSCLGHGNHDIHSLKSLTNKQRRKLVALCFYVGDEPYNQNIQITLIGMHELGLYDD